MLKGQIVAFTKTCAALRTVLRLVVYVEIGLRLEKNII